jgi:SUMO ligase MMS21 Smc5/6 complex component
MVTGVVEAIASVEVCPIETVEVCSNVACCSVDISDSTFVGDEVMEL